MKLRTRLSTSVVACIFALTTINANADWIGDFYNAAGAGSNVTMPQAISSQSAVGFSGGGLTWRVPNKNFQPVRITPPSLKAGCGGIDAYLGSYSFVNKDEFVQALRNFGQAAVGYFFELALRTMAPEIAVTLDVINDLATRMNQFSMNSCASAKAAVNTLAGPLLADRREEAAGYAKALGGYVDSFAANFDMKTDYAKTLENKYKQNYGKDRSALVDADAGKALPVHVNVLRWAIDNANATDLSVDEKDLIMSMVGPTLIITSADTGDGTKNDTQNSKPATIKFADLVGTDPFGGTATGLKLLVCSDSQVECLEPVESVKFFKPFNVRALEAANAIKANISGRIAGGTLSSEHLTVLKLSSVPLYRAAAMSESAGVAAIVAESLISDLADYTAVDAAVRMVNYYMAATDKALSVAYGKLPSAYHPELQAMRTRITDLKADMNAQVRHFYRQKGDPIVKIDQLDKAERMMYANLNTMLAANARFSKRQ